MVNYLEKKLWLLFFPTRISASEPLFAVHNAAFLLPWFLLLFSFLWQLTWSSPELPILSSFLLIWHVIINIPETPLLCFSVSFIFTSLGLIVLYSNSSYRLKASHVLLSCQSFITLTVMFVMSWFDRLFWHFFPCHQPTVLLNEYVDKSVSFVKSFNFQARLIVIHMDIILRSQIMDACLWSTLRVFS